MNKMTQLFILLMLKLEDFHGTPFPGFKFPLFKQNKVGHFLLDYLHNAA